MTEALAMRTEVVANTFKGIVTLPNPAIDEIAAICVFETLYGIQKEIIFYGLSGCLNKEIDDLISDGYFPIEVGGYNYRQHKLGSAAEMVANIAGCTEASLSAGTREVFELLEKENNRGCLKRYPMSIVWMIQELYHFPEYNMTDLVNRAKEVVGALIDDLDRKSGMISPVREDLDMTSELADIFETTEKCQNAPFTPGRYMRDMWRLGEPVEKIQERVSFWVTAWSRFQEEYAKAKEEWSKIAKENFSFGNMAGVAISTSNRFVSKIASRSTNVLINRNPDTGHTVIMTARKNLSALNRELQRREPDMWYYHEQAGNLINGGPSYPSVRPTGLALSELANLVVRFSPA